MPTDLFGPYRLNEDHVVRIRKNFKDANVALEKLIETLKQLRQAFGQSRLADLEQQMQDLIAQTVAADTALSKAVAQVKCGEAVVY